MTKRDHVKLRRRERGERAEIEAPAPSKKAANKAPNSKWLELQFGEYIGHQLPLLFKIDLPCFCNTVVEHFFEGPNANTEIAKQARYICNRACNIFPPGPLRDNQEFLIIIDRDKIFERFILVWKGEPLRAKLARGSRVVDRVSTLDFTIPYKHRQPAVGLSRLSECLNHAYGWSEAPNPIRKIEVHFEYDKNFNVAAIAPANESCA